MPTITFRSDYYKVQPFFNGEGIQIFSRPGAHTDGDSFVWFRTSDVIATGDLFSTVTYPVIDVNRGGSIQGEIDALNAILDIAFPEFRLEGGTMIVPGHGRIADSADVTYYRDMVTIIRDRVQDMIARGLTLEQVQAAQPTADYDPRYDTKEWPASKFTEAVYRSLSSHEETLR
jgi:glyoxylase-like metal-dependent hydrolase (beta-lactamase superfamily II)